LPLVGQQRRRPADQVKAAVDLPQQKQSTVAADLSALEIRLNLAATGT